MKDDSYPILGDLNCGGGLKDGICTGCLDSHWP